MAYRVRQENSLLEIEKRAALASAAIAAHICPGVTVDIEVVTIKTVSGMTTCGLWAF